jgi:phage tail-like protein
VKRGQIVSTHIRTAVLLVAFLLVGSSAALTQPEGVGVSRYQFTVQIEGLTLGAFREVTGLGVETEVIELREGGSRQVRKVPGVSKFPNVTLKRGITGSTDLYDWAVANLGGKDVRRSVTITVSDTNGVAIATWTLNRAWPVKWQAPSFNASAHDVLIETIELAHEGVSMSGMK